MFKWPQFKWSPNNNIVSGGPGPFHLMFANQFKRVPSEIKVFYPKSC